MTTHSKASDVEAREREAAQLVLMELHDLKYSFSVRGMRTAESTITAAANIIQQMLARASQQPSAQWVACVERLPEVVRYPDGSVNAVLAWGINAPDGGINFDVSNTLFLHHGNREQRLFSHWMPLPEPPLSPDTERAE